MGLGLQSDKRPHEYAALAQRAEAAGFDVISVFHDLLFQPAIFPLLTIAASTERVRLGPAALNPSTLHPVELAGQAAALDLASGGRAYLGLVAGAWLDRLLLRLVGEAENDENTRAIVITGAIEGKFITHYSVDELANAAANPAECARTFPVTEAGFHRTLDRIMLNLRG